MSRDEGAAQTRVIMRAVRALRMAKSWTAERLAAEMTAAGVPWNDSIVVNLELGRRRSLRVHELYALAYVLDVPPIDLLAPRGNRFPVLPGIVIPSVHARAWITGQLSLRPDDSDDAIRKAFDLPSASAEDIALIRRVLGPVILPDREGEK